ncbi:MAG TPA: Stp1/IreP family PP2C-type Ser/Thr phosphatase [Actinomycetes bacterium]|nr:Stp1/IreP family PP2C-type Ser/Thr phosphatase [Actinomycetes bacterium]
MALALRYAARSDTGLIRAINEDSGYAGPRLLVIADGVGGHAAGEVASSVAVASMAALDEDSPGGDLLERLSAAVTNANQHLRDMVHGDPDLKGMGTTLTALLRAGSRLGLVHVGDSRAYLLRGETLQQLTHDHTFVQTLVDEGRITAEEADHHPQRNLITNSLDGREDIELDLSVRETKAGDRYLLCSDGLSGVVSEDTLRDTLLDEADTDVVVERLVDLALKGGGPDNITAIVADVVEVETKPPSAVPVTVGAAAQGVAQRSPGDTPAGKAAALRPPPEDPPPDEGTEAEPRPRRSGPLLIALVLLLLLVGAGGYGAYRWSQTQYYVGAEGSSVAIFRGLTQDVGPIATSELYSDEEIPLADLPPYQQERVLADIPTAGLTDARRIVATLREQAEVCREQAAAAASPSPTASASPSAGDTSASPTPTASPTPSPTGGTGGGVSAADCGDGS